MHILLRKKKLNKSINNLRFKGNADTKRLILRLQDLWHFEEMDNGPTGAIKSGRYEIIFGIRTHHTRPKNKSFGGDFTIIPCATRGLASNLLEACGNNLEMAINMHMEGVSDGAAGGQAAALPSFVCLLQDEPEVRAPIPQKQEVLVEGPEMAYTFRGRRRMARSVFDKFRDFEAEAKQQEEALLAGATPEEAASGSSSSNSSSSSSSSGIIQNKRKMKTLEDLFRPPIDLIYRGTFQAGASWTTSIFSKDLGEKSLFVWSENTLKSEKEFLRYRTGWSNPGLRAIHGSSGYFLWL
ncbi:unnamed protein product, partial [Meganyctiphanes norvegica]